MEMYLKTETHLYVSMCVITCFESAVNDMHV